MRPKINEKTSVAELGAIVCEALRHAGIDAFLSGGAVVSIYTENRYESFDLDFVTLSDRRKIHEIMVRLGFARTESRLYSHPESKAAYFHWNDRQGLNQAVAVAKSHPIDVADIEAWSKREGMRNKFQDFLYSWKGAIQENGKKIQK